MAKSSFAKKPIKPRKTCCKDSPYRCKRCPTVLKKLEKQGLAQRDGRYVVLSLDLTKAELKAARRRG
jgi:hypothetical protein